MQNDLHEDGQVSQLRAKFLVWRRTRPDAIVQHARFFGKIQ